jgi:membrane protease YdiL (CAAX protease family)
MPIRLTRSDLRTIALVLLVAAASLAVAIRYFSKAFPEASITFRVNRAESLPIAEHFLAARGIQVKGYQHAAVFNYDDPTKLYLERTQGLQKMTVLARGPVHLWRWQHRWFRPEQKEEYRVEVTPLGEIVGFDHELQESAPGANLDQAGARKIAEDFLTGVMKRNLSDLEFLEAASEKRPARTDHTFTWKQRSVDLGDGSLRIAVEVSGDQVSGYAEFVKIPDQWRRDYDRLRSRNDAAQLVDQVFWFLLSAAMIAVLILRLRDHDVPLRTAWIAGLVAAVLYFFDQLNSFSLSKFGYPTTDPYSSFLATYFARSALAALGVGTLIFLVVAAAEPVYREGLPAQLALPRALTWKGLRTRSFLIANVVGLGLTFFFFAYQTVFYLAANHLGAWAPSDIPFTNDLNTSIPWVAVLFGGFLPAVTEEMQFRAFAIPFLKKYLRSWPLAIVLAAFNWGFLHSAYPNQPFFIRGVEVGLGGIVTGLVMLRFGILATLIWHYSVDALYTAFLLLRSPNHYLMLSGGLTAGIMLLPLVVALVAYWRSGTFADEASLTNASAGVSRPPREEPAPQAETALAYQPLSRRRLLAAGVLIVLAVAVASVPSDRFGQDLKLSVTRGEAIAQANRYMAAHAMPIAGYQRAAWLRDNVDPVAVNYLLQFRTISEADRLYRQATKPVLWQVRYFKPLQKEEYSVYVDPGGGGVFAYEHQLDEDAPGASLTADQALALGQRFAAEQGFNLAGYDLQDSVAQKRKAREDYALTWQARTGNPLNVGDEHYRLEVDIAGDQVVAFSRYFKLPEAWVRQRSERKLANVLLWGLTVLVGAGLVAGFLWLFVREVRQDRLLWRKAWPVSVGLGLVFLLSELNALDLVKRQYNTDLPVRTFNLFITVSYVVSFLGVVLLAWVLVAFATGLYPDTWQLFRSSARRIWARDAAIALAVGLALQAGLYNLEALVFDRFHAYAPSVGELVSPAFATSLPSLAFLFRGISYAVFSTSTLAVFICLSMLAWRRRSWWLWVAVALILVSLGSAGAHSTGEFFVGWSLNLVKVAAAFALVAIFLRDNVAGYLAVAFIAPMVGSLDGMLRGPNPFFRWNGIALAVLALAGLAWLLVPRGKSQAG